MTLYQLGMQKHMLGPKNCYGKFRILRHLGDTFDSKAFVIVTNQSTFFFNPTGMFQCNSVRVNFAEWKLVPGPNYILKN